MYYLWHFPNFPSAHTQLISNQSISKIFPLKFLNTQFFMYILIYDILVSVIITRILIIRARALSLLVSRSVPDNYVISLAFPTMFACTVGRELYNNLESIVRMYVSFFQQSFTKELSLDRGGGRHLSSWNYQVVSRVHVEDSSNFIVIESIFAPFLRASSILFHYLEYVFIFMI